MSETIKPERLPSDPRFSCGPCKKFPGWSFNSLSDAAVGRSHRAPLCRDKLAKAIEDTGRLLEIPDDYIVAILPASDTGAMEAAMWSLLGPRGVDVFAWDVFGKVWVRDVLRELKIEDCRNFEGDNGFLPDLGQADGSRDIVFTWNGTTSGVRVPNADWIPAAREGITICDATSSAFAVPLDWQKLDVTTFSWQKLLGGEAQHGMLIMSPRAVERLESYTPPWPIPKIFSIAKDGRLNRSLFEGDTLNTPSMLCVEDYLLALDWAEREGGLESLCARADANTKVIHDWIARTPWIEHVAKDPETWSNTSICMEFSDPLIVGLSTDDKWDFVQKILDLLEVEGVAYDIGAHRLAAPGLRIWAGVTIEREDLEALMPWLEWAYHQVKAEVFETA